MYNGYRDQIPHGALGPMFLHAYRPIPDSNALIKVLSIIFQSILSLTVLNTSI